VEARVYAEDPQTGFPSTGRLHVFRPPELFGVRVDTGYREGQAITPYYDALLAKVIGSGATREQAIGRVLVALRAFVIRGVASNIALLLRVLQDKAFLRGDVHTGYLADLQARPPG
jgi:acetyl-CoA carboxylase biotin carboxylase subunit